MNSPVLFLAFANDDDAHLDLLKAESSEVFRSLKDLDKKDYIRVHREESAEVTDIFEIFSQFKDRVAVFHYAGHAGGTHLRLEGGEGDARGLAQLMGEQEHLKLVFLNGCSTRGQVETMMEAGVKAVIATTVPIQDRKAQEFSAQFYQALADRRTIEQAFNLAQAYLKSRYGDQIDVGIQAYRDIRRSQAAPVDTIPWGLYVKEEHRDEILSWKLPYYREIGLPKEVIQYIGKSFTANRSIMLVLDEMTKYNPDIYAQMVEKKGDRELRKDSNEYPAIIIQNFPWPIGSQIRLLQVYDGANLERLRHLVSTYILTSKVLCYILLSDLWEKKREGAILLPEGFASGLPLDASTYRSFDFLAQAAEIYQVFADQNVPPYVAECEMFAREWNDDQSRLRKGHQYLEQIRVQLASDPPTSDLERLCLNAEKAVSFVLRAAAFLARYRMLTVRNIMIQAPRFVPIEYELDMGRLNAQGKDDLKFYQDDYWRRKDTFTNSRSIVLSRDEDRINDCLNLSPFIVDKNTFAQVKKSETTEKDKLAHIFIMAYEEAADRLVYLSVDHGIHDALGNEHDKINTQMTQDEFIEGRNMEGGEKEMDDLFGEDPLEVQAAVVDTSPKVFSRLQIQYDDFKADLIA